MRCAMCSMGPRIDWLEAVCVASMLYGTDSGSSPSPSLLGLSKDQIGSNSGFPFNQSLAAERFGCPPILPRSGFASWCPSFHKCFWPSNNHAMRKPMGRPKPARRSCHGNIVHMLVGADQYGFKGVQSLVEVMECDAQVTVCRCMCNEAVCEA